MVAGGGLKKVADKNVCLCFAKRDEKEEEAHQCCTRHTLCHAPQTVGA